MPKVNVKLTPGRTIPSIVRDLHFAARGVQEAKLGKPMGEDPVFRASPDALMEGGMADPSEVIPANVYLNNRKYYLAFCDSPHWLVSILVNPNLHHAVYDEFMLDLYTDAVNTSLEDSSKPHKKIPHYGFYIADYQRSRWAWAWHMLVTFAVPWLQEEHIPKGMPLADGKKAIRAALQIIEAVWEKVQIADALIANPKYRVGKRRDQKVSNALNSLAEDSPTGILLYMCMTQDEWITRTPFHHALLALQDVSSPKPLLEALSSAVYFSQNGKGAAAPATEDFSAMLALESEAWRSYCYVVYGEEIPITSVLMPTTLKRAVEEFYYRVRTPLPDPTTPPVLTRGEPCHLWVGPCTSDGYGMVFYDTRKYMAHRWIYEVTVGVIEEGKDLDHVCRVRNCVNTKHLDQVSRKENLMRSEARTAINARKTHCVRGHEFTPENTVPNGTGRKCRTCHNAQKRNSRKKGKEDNTCPT